METKNYVTMRYLARLILVASFCRFSSLFSPSLDV